MKRSFFFAIFALLAVLPAAAFAGTHSILAVRVDFIPEEPDHDTTYGQGYFDLRDYYDESEAELRRDYRNPWDVPPHDRNYFENHLTALYNYWHTVSEGRVEIDYDIWPRENDAAYTMSKKYYKYGNGRSKEQTYQKLVELLKEALIACKEAEGSAVDFSDYDTFMIIHAGIGYETSGMLNDIPSAFISTEDIRTYLDEPLVIDGVTIDNGLVVPEMTAANGYGGLNGIMAQMFGHRLGLPSMSNNEDGLPAAGGWCLMDTGSMSYGGSTRGFVPTHPCAWSKIELGWVDPLLVSADTTVDIIATHVEGDGVKAVKVPINDDEYLLLENRYRAVSRDSLATAVYSDTDSSGVWLSVDHYDAYIPGSGILIWHINDAVIREKRATNEINDDLYRRGIDLLEADGLQDIGAMMGFGDERTEYSEGHDDDTYKSNEVNVLSPETEPNSGSVWGAESGITITVNSEPGESMNVIISFGGRVAGFPVQLSGETDISAVDADNDGKDDIVYSIDKKMNIISSAGTKLYTSESPLTMPAAYVGDGSQYPLFVALDTIEPTAVHTLSLDNDGSITNFDSFVEKMVLIAPPAISNLSDGDSGYLFNTELSSLDGVLEQSTVFYQSISGSTYLNITTSDSLRAGSFSIAQTTVSAVNDDHKVFIGQMQRGEEHAEFTDLIISAEILYDSVLADFDQDDSYESAIVTDSELYIVELDGRSSSASLPSHPVASPAAADIDGDGYPEVIVSCEDGVYAYRTECAPVDCFPYHIPPGDASEKITTSPIIADMDGDGSLDIGVATSSRRFLAFDTDGVQADGFPLSLSGRVEKTPCLFRYDSDGTLGLAYVTTDGLLDARDLGSLYDSHLMPWPMWKGGADLANSLTNDEIYADKIVSASFNAYCYPNPISGNYGTFRFTPESATDCRITVFTPDGKKVWSVHVPEGGVLPGVPNEVTFNTADLASGLYIAKISTKRNSIFYKFGVLK